MTRPTLKRVFAVLIAMLFVLTGCGRNAPVADSPAIRELILATTTSTQDSGLLDVILPVFEQGTGYIVQVIAVGTGQALQMGQEGNADVLLVHAPGDELEFMDGGYGAVRRLVMHNDFVIVGPADDPAGVRGMTSAAEALAAIANVQSPFVSRGDDSGTHKKELSLWHTAGISPEGGWYSETGQGMGATLRIASEQSAYTLTDRATFLANMDALSLDVLVEGDSTLLNVYHVMIVNPAIWPEVNIEGATAFADFLVSDEGQAIIAGFGIEQYGQPLFFADAGKTDADLGLP
ncbi:MAG: substrate-binding domain-containing protein [Chloroflexota bacterium]